MKLRIMLLILLLVGCGNVLSADAQKQPPDKIKATRFTEGTFVGFEVGDYMHAVIENARGKRESYFLSPSASGIEYFLALNKGRKVKITYQVVDSYIPEAGGVETIERISAASVGNQTYSAWWRKARKTMTLPQLEKKYRPLVDKVTLTQ
jgi:hypothetical protein